MSAKAYPEFMNIREGKLLLSEADWPPAYGGQWGALFVGAGTITTDTVHKWGGPSAAVLTTGIVASNLTELKVNVPDASPVPNIYAMECKFIPDLQFGANHFHMGIEDRKSTTPFKRGHIRYTVSGDVLEYESANGVFSAIPGISPMERPFLSTVNGSGDRWGWLRLVVNFDTGKYVSLEYISESGYEKIDMSSLDLPDIATGDTTTQLLCFVFGDTPASSATVYYTTDWAISKVPF